MLSTDKVMYLCGPYEFVFTPKGDVLVMTCRSKQFVVRVHCQTPQLSTVTKHYLQHRENTL